MRSLLILCTLGLALVACSKQNGNAYDSTATSTTTTNTTTQTAPPPPPPAAPAPAPSGTAGTTDTIHKTDTTRHY